MLLQPYSRDELRFAYCSRAYLRWRTHRRRPQPPLAQLDATRLQPLMDPYAIHVLECASDAREVRVLVSLQPTETIATCASKLKGQTSKWLKQALELHEPMD